VIGDQEHDGPDRCHEQAIEIQTRCTTFAEQIRQETADDRTENAQQNIANATVASLVNNLATDETD
jgi:hypothetical protein